MRTEQEMFDLIINVANQDQRIRAVVMNGSRTNPNVKKDIFQDYDIVYIVEEINTFRQDKSWIDQFGKRLYMQYPEEHSTFNNDIENTYGWLIQFVDGNRLDLHVSILSKALEDIKSDKLCKIHLDKDNVLPCLPEATDEDYWIKRPTEKQFIEACNEYWWCLNNVAKGLWRQEIPYVMDMLNFHVRPQLVRLIEWKIGYETKFSVSVGKSGKYLNQMLDAKIWNLFLETYSNAEVENIWQAVFNMCDLFNEVAKEVSHHMNVKYDEDEANGSLMFLRDVSVLSKDAKAIY